MHNFNRNLKIIFVLEERV